MPRIIFVRPAETDFLQQDYLLGRFDADLNEVGHRAARTLGEALLPYQPSYLAASPLKRALATAMAIEDSNPEVSAYPIAAFHAMDLGDWEKKTRMELMQGDHRRYMSWLQDSDFRAPGGESMREVYARAFPELVNQVNHGEHRETLVMVLEESVIKALSCAVLDLPLEHAQRFSMDAAAYSVFERIYEGGPYQLMAWNRKAHLVCTHHDLPALEEPVPT